MALNLNLLSLLAALSLKSGRVLTLGVQKVNFPAQKLADTLHVPPLSQGAINQDDVFRALGFDITESLDVSSYEGAQHIFDLNELNPPAHLLNAYDLVFTGGTLEHVFHVSHALQNAASFVRPGGLLVHLGPANNWINHGFYQLCPMVMLDYFEANEWDIEISALIDVMALSPNHWRIKPGHRKVKPEGIRQLHFIAAWRAKDSTIHRVPKQKVYQHKHDGKDPIAIGSSFTPYDLLEGQRI